MLTGTQGIIEDTCINDHSSKLECHNGCRLNNTTLSWALGHIVRRAGLGTVQKALEGNLYVKSARLGDTPLPVMVDGELQMVSGALISLPLLMQADIFPSRYAGVESEL